VVPFFFKFILRDCLISLTQKGLRAVSRVRLQVKFRGAVVGDFYADVLVEDKVPLELKAVSFVLPEYKTQTRSYLKNRRRVQSSRFSVQPTPRFARVGAQTKV
jgi:GxxExxY protein